MIILEEVLKLNTLLKPCAELSITKFVHKNRIQIITLCRHKDFTMPEGSDRNP